MKKVIEIIIRSILIIILFASLLAFSILNIISKTVCTESYVLKKLEETNYYGNIYTQIKSDFRNYIFQSGLDENVIEDIVTLDEVKDDTKKMITGIYNGISEEIKVDKIEERLNNNINKSLEGRSLTPEIREAIQIFVNQITTQYEETLSKTIYKNNIYQHYSKIETVVKTGEKASIIIALVSGILITIINFKKIFKNIGFLGIPFLSAGISCKVIHSYITQKIYIQYFTILNDAVSITLREYLSGMVKEISKYGYIYIGIGITLIFLGNAIHGWKYHNHKKNKQSEKKEGNLSRQTEQIVYKQIFGQEENSGYNHNYQIYKKEREEKKAKKEKTKEIVKEVKKIQKNNKKEEKKYPRKNRGKHA